MSDAFAGDRLFEREPGPDEVRDWTATLARVDESSVVRELVSVIMFEIAGEALALPTVQLQEVVEPVPVHRVPNRRGSILRGLVNIRGRLELCVSLEALLGLPAGDAPSSEQSEKMLLAGGDGRRFAFVVCRVTAIAKIPRDALAEYHEGQYVRQSFSWAGRLVGLLESATLHEALLEAVRR